MKENANKGSKNIFKRSGPEESKPEGSETKGSKRRQERNNKKEKSLKKIWKERIMIYLEYPKMQAKKKLRPPIGN